MFNWLQIRNGRLSRRLASFRSDLAATPGDRLFIQGAFFLWCIAVPAAWALQSYWNIPLTQVISAGPNDGWCATAQEGFGVHCFGDYAFPAKLAASGDVWNNEFGIPHSYPAFGMLPFKLTSKLSSLTSLPRLGVLTFLFVAVVAMLVPAGYVIRRKTSWPTWMLFFVVGFGSLPFLITFDRANIVALLVPLILGFSVCVYKERYTQAAIYVAFAAAMKPQFLLLLVVFVALRRAKPVVLALLGSGILTILGFLVWPGDPVRNFSDWLANIGRFEDYQSVTQYSPANLSASHAVYSVGDALSRAPSILGSIGTELSSFVESDPRSVGIVLLGAVVLTFWVRGPNLGVIPTIVIAVSLPTLVPGLSFAYNLVFVLPIVALVLAHPDSLALPRWLLVSFTAVLALSCVPIPIVVSRTTNALIPMHSGLLWLLMTLLLLGFGWTSRGKPEHAAGEVPTQG